MNIARHHFGWSGGGYFDDFSTIEPSYAGASGKLAIRRSLQILGFLLDGGDKDVPMRASNPFLGVISDFSRLGDGYVIVRPKPSRVAKLLAALKEVRSADTLSPTEAATLRGKLEWTSSTAYLGLGRAALTAFTARQYDESGDYSLGTALLQSIDFFLDVLAVVQGCRVVVRRTRKRRPLVIWTDASYSAEHGGRVGVVIYDPLKPAGRKWLFAGADVPAAVLARFRRREQYIGQLEALAGVLPYSSLPHLVRGRDVIHFIDNVGALASLTRASSADIDTARLAFTLSTIRFALKANTWFMYVPSKANIADLPSRAEMAHELSVRSARRFEIVWPAPMTWLGRFRAVLGATSRLFV